MVYRRYQGHGGGTNRMHARELAPAFANGKCAGLQVNIGPMQGEDFGHTAAGEGASRGSW